MARSRGEPMKVPPPESESSDEEEGSSEESGSEESDPETEQTQTQTPAKPQQPPPPQPKESSSSSGEEESGSDSEVESDAPASKVKPLASKPVVEKQKASDGASKSKTIAPDPVTPKKSAAAKRPSEDTSSKDAKKSKKADEPDTSEKKSNLFQRLWSEEDEIVVLEGMIDYASKKKADPVLDLSAFHDFIKQKLSIEVTRTQLQDKIRRLKKKYENNKSKEKDGEQKTFSKPHEHKSYDLSKLIWGKRNETIKENGAPKATSRVARKTDSIKAEDMQSERSLTSNSVGANVEERMLIAGQMLELEGKEEWEKLKEEEFELYLKQLEVKVAQTKLVLDAMKGRGH